MKKYEFDAIIQSHGEINAAYVEFPYDVEVEFGTKGQVKVIATFDGTEYRGSLVKMDHHCHLLGITKKIRTEINKQQGDAVHVVLYKDIEERTVVIPNDLQQAFDKDKNLLELFNMLSYTHRKEYVNWINEARKVETRKKRLEKTILMLKDNSKS